MGNLTAPVGDPPLCICYWVTMDGILPLVAGREPPVMALGVEDTGACGEGPCPGYPHWGWWWSTHAALAGVPRTCSPP